MVGGGKSKKTGTNRKGASLHKRGVRKKFRARHIDQVWQDVRKPTAVHDGKVGPVGTSDRVGLDEDMPGHGKHYCTPCARYFVTDIALATHEKTKPHKRRLKELEGPQPHNQVDADWAGGMGLPDNGMKTSAMQVA